MCVIEKMKQLPAISKPDVAIRSYLQQLDSISYVFVMEVSQKRSTDS